MSSRLPSLNLLRIFEAAGRHLSFKRAAEELHVTPSAVSHQVKALEADLGFALFRRGNRTLELTEGGRAYLGVVSRALVRLREGTNRVRRTYGASTLRMSLMPTLARHVVIPRLKSFRARVPGIKLHIEATNATADLQFEDVDLAVRYGLGQWPGVHSAKLLDLEVGPVCTADLAASVGLDRIDALARAPVLCMSMLPDAWRHWTEAAGLAGFTAVDELWLDSYDATIQAAEQGHGVALAIFPADQVLVDEGRLVEPFACRIATPYALHLVCREGEESRPELLEFRDWLLEQFVPNGTAE